MEILLHIKIKTTMTNKKSYLLLISCFLLICTITADEIDISGASEASDDGSSSLTVASSYQKPDYKQKVFVSIDKTHFYEYTVRNKNNKIQISILDQDLKTWQLQFRRQNAVQFIDAYNHIVLVQQVSPTNAILSLFVIQIIYDEDKCEFYLKYFAVNSIVDDQFFYFDKPWWITQILQYNPIQNWISIPKVTKSDINIYKINVGNQLNTLLTVGWFDFDSKRRQQIDGGNSKVLYDRRNDQLMIDQNNCRYSFTDPTIYQRVPICQLTKYPLYPKQGRTINLVSWFFQYTSQSKNCKQLTTFLYQGYGDLPIINPAHLKSTTEIIYHYDDYSFFAAITDCDIYLTNVYWNEKAKKYNVYSNLLSNTCPSAKKREQIVRDWSSAIEIVFVEGNFYLLTKNKFIVYSDCPNYWNKVYEVDCVNVNNDATVTLFKQIDKYLDRKW